MPRLGLDVGRRRVARGSGSAPTPPPRPSPPVGFAANGAANPALRAMLARVGSGAGRGKLILLGDSTTVGQGGGTGTNGLVGAAGHRIARKLAALLSASGLPALDGSVTGDNGMGRGGGVTLPQYDGRIAMGNWTANPDDNAPSRSFLRPNAAALTFAPGGSVDTVEVLNACYTGNSVTLLLDGAAAAQVLVNGAAQPAGTTTLSQSGATPLQRITLRRASPGSVVLSATGGNQVGVIGFTAYDSTAPAIDVKTYGALGLAGAMTTSADAFYTRAILRFEAADLLIVNLGINDFLTGASREAWLANVGALVETAAGDVLVVFPHGWSGADDARLLDWNDALKGWCASRGCAFFSLREHFGPYTPEFGASLTFDGLHGNAAFNAAVADAYRRCIVAMAG